MKLYFSPGACSLASNIALREAGVPFELAKVDKQTKSADGKDFLAINPKGYVPALQLDDGTVLTENVALLPYIADRNPSAGLAPPTGTMERYRLEEWLSFISSELHSQFSPFFSPDAAEESKQSSRKKLTKRLDYLQKMLAEKPQLVGDTFSVADAYLFVILRWSSRAGLELDKWPALKSFADRISARPHVKEAMQAEGLTK